MRKLLIIGFFFAFSFYAFSQADFYAFSQKGVNVRIDSLKRTLPASIGFERINCLNELSEAYLSFDLDTAKVYASQALNEAEKITYTKGKAQAYKNLGRIECIVITNLPSAEKYFALSLNLFMKTKDREQIAWTWEALGYAKWVLGKFQEAMEAFKKAEQIFIAIGDTANLSGTYEFMSSAEAEWGHYDKSLEYVLKHQDLTGKEYYGMLSGLYASIGDYETAFEYCRRTPIDTEGGIWNCLGLAGLFWCTKQYDSALHYYQLFSGYAKSAGSTGPLCKLYTGLGQLHQTLKNYDTALMYLNEALMMSSKANDQNQKMRVLLILSNTYKERGDFTEAMQSALQLSEMANKTGARKLIADAHFLLYELFDSLHNNNKAYLHLKKYAALKDSMDAELSARKLAFYKTKSEREQAQASIKSLNEEKKLQQLKLKQTAQQKRFLTAAIVALLIIGVVFFRNILLKRKNEKHRREIAENSLQIEKLENEKQQAALHQQKTDLEMQALRAQMNPHFIFNCLNAINSFILKNEPDEASDYLSKFSKLIRMVLQLSQRNFISLTEELEHLELYIQMEQLRFANVFSYTIDCGRSIDAESIKIPPLLLQPFVENAIWHGLMHKKQNGQLAVLLTQENGMLICTIRDNGIGREKAALLKKGTASYKKSLGLQLTKNRLQLLNEENNEDIVLNVVDLKNESGDPTGTKVIIKIPVKVVETTPETI